MDSLETSVLAAGGANSGLEMTAISHSYPGRHRTCRTGYRGWRI